ncbi:MAG: PEGA domain-containing protein [Parcubacteria group bacterium]|nr:PEGA domain-containing protein [Parcubacteria group bacterium]
MKLVHRRLLVLFLFLLFIAAAPLTVLYASGYRYNTRLGRIEQAGLLFVTTKQKGIRVVVDGQTYDIGRQLRLDHLRPRAYDILLEKDGYHSWNKRLDIYEGQTTYIRDVLLFADALPVLVGPVADDLSLADNLEAEAPLLSIPLIKDVQPDGQAFWVLADDPGKQRTFLYHVSERSARPRFLLSLPYSTDMRIADVDGGFLTVMDTSGKQLHLIDANTDLPVITTLPGTHAFAWSPSHEELLTATDYEVMVHQLQNGHTQELVVRLSSPIGDIAWHEAERHVFYTSHDALFVAERDSRDQRNVVELTAAQADLHIVSIDEDEVRFTSQQDGQTLLWRLAL